MPQTCLVNLFELMPARNGGRSRIAFNDVCIPLAEDDRAGRLTVIFAVGWQFADSFPEWIGYKDVKMLPCLPEVGITPLIDAVRPDFIISPLFGTFPFDDADSSQYGGLPHLVGMPDTLALDMPELFSEQERLSRQQTYQNLQNAWKIVVPSEFSKRSLINHLAISAEKVQVIHHGSGLSTKPIRSVASPISVPYILYPANSWPHKRHDLLFEIMAEVWKKRPDLHLALTGGYDQDLIKTLIGAHERAEGRVHSLGYVSDSELLALYQSAEALLFVSEYEGFGMPPVEAMENGCPVICAPVTSLPEVAGDAALYINSEDPADWAHALLEKLPAQREELIAKGYAQAKKFSWERSRAEWRQVMIEMGLRLGPETEVEAEITQVTLPLKTVNEELAIWAKYHAVQQTELNAKEEQIHKSAAAFQTTIQEKERAIDAFKLQLLASTEEANFYRSLRWTSPYFWVLVAIDRAKKYVGRFRHILGRRWQALKQKWLMPTLEVFYQYPPKPLEVPDSYTKKKSFKNSTLPTISIVTPTLNQAAFIQDTLESVLSQNYAKLEYIVQDGLSTDETPEILERYKDRLAHVESRKDTGQSNAINMGFAHTSGEIMAYLNSDDILLPGTLHYVGRYFAEHPEIDVIYGSRVIIDENGLEVGRWVIPPGCEDILSWADYVPQETLFWRRSIWERAGGQIDESFRFAMDWDLLLRFRDAGAKFKQMPRFMGAFRVHSQQKTSAQIIDIGAQEMSHLRERANGKPISQEEASKNIKPYLKKHVLYQRLYEMGILRY